MTPRKKLIHWIVKAANGEYAQAYDDEHISSWGPYKHAYRWESKEAAKNAAILVNERYGKMSLEVGAKVQEVHTLLA